jgi:hypothetical protein
MIPRAKLTSNMHGSKEIAPISAEHRMTLLDKEMFLRRALPRLAEFTFGYICSIIGNVSNVQGTHYGTALRCLFNGRRAIVTALHVIEAARHEPLGISISTGFGEAPYPVEGEIHIDPVADIAVFFVPDDYPQKSFWECGRIDFSRDNLDTDYLFLHGFPGSKSRPLSLRGGIVSKSLPYGAMRRLENLPPDVDEFQFAVEYDPLGMRNDTGAAAELVDPHGLSGSPVWRIGISGRSSRDWQPADCLLVGVVTQWRPDNHVLIATSMSRIPPSWRDGTS